MKFLPHQSEIAHEFEINPTDVLFNAYDITEKKQVTAFFQKLGVCMILLRNMSIFERLMQVSA